MTGAGDYIAAIYDNTTNMSYTADNNVTSLYDYICAYDSFANPPNTTYCAQFDRICSGRKDNRDSTNCHCMYRTDRHFCELSCNYTEYNDTTCMGCESIVHKYNQPSISLALDFFNNRIFITIKSFLKLAPVETDNIMYCFTDAQQSPHDITYRYNCNNDSTKCPHTYNDSYSTIHYTIQPIDNSIGHYWCKGFDYQYLDELTSGTIIAEGTGTEESFTMNVTIEEDVRQFPLTIHEQYGELLDNITRETALIAQVRFLNLWERNYTSNTTTIAYRLYLNQTNNMTYVLDTISSVFDSASINVSLTPSYCLPDTTDIDNTTLHWEKTLLGVSTIPTELCLTSDSQPVTRTCVGEYLYGTYWSGVSASCSDNNGTDSTGDLHNLTYASTPADAKLQQLKSLITSDHISIDVHFMARIFDDVSRSSDNDTTRSSDTLKLSELVEVVSDIMEMNRDVLRQSQSLLNSTDMLLYSLDLALGDHVLNGTDCVQIQSKNVYVQISNISSNVTGLALYESGGTVELRNMTTKDNLDNLDKNNLQIAAFVTETQLQQARRLNYPDAKLVIKLFRFDSIFNDGSNPTVSGYLAGVHITGFEIPFVYDYIRVLVKPDRKYRADKTCYHYQYGRDGLWYNTRGRWKRYNASLPTGDFSLCKYDRFASFAILIGMESSLVLSIVTAVGCALSILGNLAVVVTAVVYRSWREKSGTKILLNFVLTNLVQNVVLSVSSAVDSYQELELCVTVGALLHYSVCSQFTWMAFIGYLQYMRYVRVFYTIETRFLLVASLVAWLLPLIPVVAVLTVDYSDYQQDEFCYLNNEPLYYGVFLPLALTITTNIIIFVIILVNIYKKNDPLVPRDTTAWLNLRLAIIMFFLLGLYWVFGISARFLDSIALDYFFCLSASLQGFVVFVYFIIFNKMTKNFWWRQLKISEMLTSMQIWLQQKRRMGKVKIDTGIRKSIKLKIVKSLGRYKKRNGLEKLA
jgi:hypothetical protein